MDEPEDLDAIPYVAAVHQSAHDGTPTLVVIHSMECPLEPNRAGNVAHWFAGPSSPQASAHYMVDPDETWCGVQPPNVAWHVGAANLYGGNPSIGIEQTGYAAYSTDEWLAGDGSRQLDRIVDLVGALCDRYGIPRVWLDVDALHRGESGISTHGLCTAAGIGTDHTDPGPNWPVDVFLHRLNGNPTPTPTPKEDDVNVYFMQPKGDPAIYCVQANLSSRFHIDSLAHMNDIYYVLAQNGGKVLIPPAPGGININGFWVWSAEPAFVAMIPLAA